MMIILVNILSNCPKTENFHAIRKCLIKNSTRKKGVSAVRYPVAFFMPERKKSGEEEDFIM